MKQGYSLRSTQDILAEKGSKHRMNRGAEKRKKGGADNRKKGEENRKRGEENRKMGAEKRKKCTLGPLYLRGAEKRTRGAEYSGPKVQSFLFSAPWATCVGFVWAAADSCHLTFPAGVTESDSIGFSDLLSTQIVKN